jgi:hypothetical protein
LTERKISLSLGNNNQQRNGFLKKVLLINFLFKSGVTSIESIFVLMLICIFIMVEIRRRKQTHKLILTKKLKEGRKKQSVCEGEERKPGRVKSLELLHFFVSFLPYMVASYEIHSH